ncbi:MAG: helix-hairpin-helix domain-containing protein, partial [Chitinispirillia bacterium]
MTTITQEEELSGIVERVTYHNIQTGWSVVKVAPFSSPANIVAVVLHQVKIFAGASMKFYGTWITHQKYGHQFKAEKVLEIKPASTAALEKYLGSGLIKGVGPKTAKKIVNFFGDNTLSVFEDKIEYLMKVPGIARKKLSIIQISWEEHREIRDVMIFLQSHGVSTLFAVKIFKQYGRNAIDTVSQNPYQLAQDIYGIGFFSADKIALKLGFKKNSPKRILAGVNHVLASSREEGHCYLTKNQIISNTKILLELENEEIISESIDILLKEHAIKCRILPEGNDLVSCYYSKTLYYDEEKVSQKIKLLSSLNITCDPKRVKNWVKRYCTLKNISLSDEQNSSIEGIVQKSFSILTGGPGCGKTTTLKVLVRLLISMKKKVLLTAPTGRAAQRMSEVIGVEAKTIHRLLEWE